MISTWIIAAVEESRRSKDNSIDSPLGRLESLTSWSANTLDDNDGTDSNSSKLNMSEQLGDLIEFMEMALLSPMDLHDEIHPQPKPFDSSNLNSGATTPVARKGGKSNQIPAVNYAPFTVKTEDDTTNAEEELQRVDRIARYNLGGTSGLIYILQKLPSDLEIPERLGNLLAATGLWNMLDSNRTGDELASAPVRRGLYSLLTVLVTRHETYTKEKLLTVAGPAVLSSVWKETDGSVLGGVVVAEAVTVLLTRFREVWLLHNDGAAEESGTQEQADDDGEESDAASESEDEADADPVKAYGDRVEADDVKKATLTTNKATLGSKAYSDFLAYLQKGCNGSPNEGYPTVLVVLSTIPAEVSRTRSIVSIHR